MVRAKRDPGPVWRDGAIGDSIGGHQQGFGVVRAVGIGRMKPLARQSRAGCAGRVNDSIHGNSPALRVVVPDVGDMDAGARRAGAHGHRLPILYFRSCQPQAAVTTPFVSSA